MHVTAAAKRVAARLGFPAARMLVRSLPFPDLVISMLRDLFTPYLSWRPFETITTTRDGLRMRVRFPDKIQKHIYLFGVWEPAITRFVNSRLRRGDLFIDIGANVGYYALLAAHRVGPGGAVVAIEASPSISCRLRENIALNGFTNIEVIQAAVSHRRQMLQLFAAASDNLGATTTVPATALRAGLQLEARVEGYPLHELIDAGRLRCARLIKVDVEGAEGDVFDGIRDLLPTFGDRTEWIFELTPDALETQGRGAGDILRLFATSGYRLYAIENGYRMEHYVRAPAPALEEITRVPDTRMTVDVIATKRESARRVLL
jgi:FkbM family methyltransferase